MGRSVENSTADLSSAQGIVTIDVSAADQILGNACRGVMVTAAGDIAVTMADGSSGTLPALSPGTLYPFAVKAFKKVGTSATGIKAFV